MERMWKSGCKASGSAAKFLWGLGRSLSLSGPQFLHLPCGKVGLNL